MWESKKTSIGAVAGQTGSDESPSLLVKKKKKSQHGSFLNPHPTILALHQARPFSVIRADAPTWGSTLCGSQRKATGELCRPSTRAVWLWWAPLSSGLRKPTWELINAPAHLSTGASTLETLYVRFKGIQHGSCGRLAPEQCGAKPLCSGKKKQTNPSTDHT